MNGLKLKNYKIVSTLGSGTFGRVFLVKNKKDKQLYAAKVSNISLKGKSDKDDNIQLISREIDILSKINHPAILKFYGFSKTDFENNLFPTFIIEYARNDNLGKILDSERNGLAPSEWDDTKKYLNLFGIAYGMSFLHSNNIIHRDLKPDNIMEDEYLLPKIGDFGLSKIFDPNQRSKQSMIGGTLFYMAPEMFIEDHYNNSVDVYAFSMILFEVLTGEEPYSEIKNPNAIQIKVVDGYRPALPKGIVLSDPMNDLLSRCWSQNPSDRPTFSQIVELMKDTDFIKNCGLGVDEDDFLSYLDFLESEVNSFDSDKKGAFNIESFIKDTKKSSIRKVLMNEMEAKEPKKKSRFSLFSKKGEKKKAQTDVQQLKQQKQHENQMQNQHAKPNDDHQEKTIDDDTNSRKMEEKNKNKIKTYPIIEYSRLSEKCKELVQEAEKGDNNSIALLSINLIEGINSFPQNVQLGIKYLNNGIKNESVECMEYYGKMLLEGKWIPSNESKAMEILKKAASKHQSDISKVLIVKHILSKESSDEELNYPLIKRYAKEAAENGNIEAIILYGRICEKKVTNRYGEIKQDFEESFRYFKLAAERGDPDGLAYYSKYLQYPHGLFTPDYKKALEMAKLAAEKGSQLGIARYAAYLLDGFGIPKNISEGFRLTNKLYKEGYNEAYYILGVSYYYGMDLEKNVEKGYELTKEGAMMGNLRSLFNYAKFNKKSDNSNKEKIDLKKIKKKLIEGGLIFFDFDEDVFVEGKNDDIRYQAAYQFDLGNYDRGLQMLKSGIENNYVGFMMDYANIITFQFKKKSEGKKLYKKAADFGDITAINNYIKYLEDGSFGQVYSTEASKYKELIEFKNKYTKYQNAKPKIYPQNSYDKLNQNCKELVIKAEIDNDKESLISLIANVIEGKNSFQRNIDLGIDYLNLQYQNNKSNVNNIISNLNKKLGNSSKVDTVNEILSKDDWRTNYEVNFPLAKAMAKDAADKGNAEAMVLYGLLCEKQVSNKYGTINTDFEEAFEYFKKASDLNYPDGMAYYAYYLEFPHGLFTPRISDAVELNQEAAKRGSIMALSRHGLHILNGTCMPKNYDEGWRYLNLAYKKGNPLSVYIYGISYRYGSYNQSKDVERGLKLIEKAAFDGHSVAMLKYGLLAKEYSYHIDTSRIMQKLIEKGFVFQCYDERLSDEDLTYDAAVQFDKKNYEEGVRIAKKGIQKKYINCLRLYAEVLATDMNRKAEGKQILKKAADFNDFSAMKDYIEYLEKGSFGRVYSEEARQYKKILEIYKDFI